MIHESPVESNKLKVARMSRTVKNVRVIPDIFSKSYAATKKVVLLLVAAL